VAAGGRYQAAGAGRSHQRVFCSGADPIKAFTASRSKGCRADLGLFYKGAFRQTRHEHTLRPSRPMGMHGDAPSLPESPFQANQRPLSDL
jgi:hypothetical protein